MSCNICGDPVETRMGACFNCASAESIIAEGLDMWDNGPNEDNLPAKTPMDKLKFIYKVIHFNKESRIAD